MLREQKRKLTWAILLMILILLMPAKAFADSVTLTAEERQYLEELAPITMVVDPDWEPFEKMDEDGNFIGLAADLVSLVETRLGVKFHIVPTADWSETLVVSQAREAHIIPFLNQTPAREEWLIFTEPLYVDPNVVITHQTTPFIADLTALDHATIVLPEGTSIEERVRQDYPNLRIVTTQDENEVFSMIENNEADLTIRSLAVAAYTIRKDGHFNLKINTQIPEYTNHLRMAVLDDQPMLRDLLNRAIETITTQERESIFNEHVNIEIQEVVNYQSLFQVVLIATLIVTFLIFAVIWLVRNKRRLTTSRNALMISQMRFMQLSEQSRTFVWECDDFGRLTYISPSVHTVLGYDATTLVGNALVDDFLRIDQGSSDIALRKIHAKEETQNMEVVQQHASGHVVYFLLSGVPLIDNEGNPFGYRASQTDISLRKKIEMELSASEQRYRMLFENAVEAIFVAQDGKIKICNPMTASISGYRKEELVNRDIEELICPEDLQVAPMQHGINSQTHLPKQVLRLIRHDKEKVWIEMQGVIISWDDQPAVLYFATDISERKRSEDEILYLSYYDQLTGLHNRRFFEEESKRLDHQRSLPVTLIVVDINGLKLFNDGLGHQIGDRLLKKVAELIKKTVRGTDLVARIGGDEFLLLLTKTDAKEAESLIERLVRQVEESKVHGYPISVSCGQATKHDRQTSLVEVFKKAEENMYHRKVNESSMYREKMMDAFAGNLFALSDWEKGHAKRVASRLQVFKQHPSLSNQRFKNLQRAGFFHDLGKTVISSRLLNQTDPLTHQDERSLQRHSEAGYLLLKSSPKHSELANMVLLHHEKWDGTGYPKKLQGSSIPLESRMLAIAEAYDDMTAKRPYRPKAMNRQEAIDELRRCSGSHFDPELVESFIKNTSDTEA